MNDSDPAWLDTNLVVRYLTDDDAALAARAASIIEGDESLLLTPAVLAECSYVLMSVYGRTRTDVIDALSMFIQRDNIRLPGIRKTLAVAALHLCRDSGRVKIVDALLWAEARSSGITTIYTFDLRFPSDGVDLRGLK